MVQLNTQDHKKYLIAALVAAFALFALWIRLIPLFTVGHTDILDMVAMDDPLYNLRQVEVMLAQFPGYAWFDPMSLYPTGTTIYWGPLFPAILAVFCLATGAVTRPEIISASLLVTPLVAAATVIAMYYAGKVFGDWKTGLLASCFTAAVGGQFFTVSFYGYIDHHIAEVLFSTIFCLVYGFTLLSEKDRKIDFKDFGSYRRTLILSLLCGCAYLLGLFVMPTMILFAMIVAVFTVVQFVIDFYRNRSSDYLLIINAVTFVVAIAGLLLFGLKGSSVDLASYSSGHIFAYLGLIGGTLLLWTCAHLLRGKPRYYYPGVLAGAGLLGIVLLFILSRPLYTLFVYDLYAFFGQQPVTNTVQEAMGWSAEYAWLSFNFGLLLLAGGILVVLYRNVREEHPHHIFALVWALVMLLATWQHIRYEYYLAICIALLSAVCVSFAVGLVWPAFAGPVPGRIRAEGDRGQDAGTSPRKKPPGKAGKRTGPSPPSWHLTTALAVIVIGFAVLFVCISVSDSATRMSGAGPQMIADWKESLLWMGNNTPETGVDYLAISNPSTFRYPGTAYGVMSWWDYGHMITFIAKRIPNANPFQQGVAGPDGSAAYFVATDEEDANRILDHDGTRYVITDILMDDIMTGKFHAMATWYNSTAGVEPYTSAFYVPAGDNSSEYEPAMFIRQDYYLTMVSRLHNFDGTMTEPSKVFYAEYADPSLTGATLPVITAGSQMNGTDALKKTEQFNANASAGRHAGVFSASLTRPVESVPALRHYRLVHESPTNVYGSASANVKFVKIFEYVKGAHIRGSGIISLPLVTNTGRHFTYRQESVNGEFVVPYATTDGSSGVRANGSYRIEGTGMSFEVPEKAVMEGTTIN
jgi:dolichyl-diphosphooligosaccharide--protein glycosyltransferase